ncbi:MAG: hypothetical protein FVQ81_03790 [Candidatus Glassbacteria bacterium]|nr:hypothetical protein [Candidatus Glassbacteria bacterium]
MRQALAFSLMISFLVILLGCQRDSNPLGVLSSEGPTLAGKGGGPVNYDNPKKDLVKKASNGIYYLVSKDAAWQALPRGAGAFGMGKFSIENGTLTMRLVAHRLTPGNYYTVELVDKTGGGWNPFSDDRYSRFYGQADEDGNVKINFSWDISGHSNIELNLKNADNVALLDPSTYGVPSEWILGTGQGWDSILFGATQLLPS